MKRLTGKTVSSPNVFCAAPSSVTRSVSLSHLKNIFHVLLRSNLHTDISSNKVVGVIQLINKKEDSDVSYFTDSDEQIIKTFTAIMAPILQVLTFYCCLSLVIQT